MAKNFLTWLDLVHPDVGTRSMTSPVSYASGTHTGSGQQGLCTVTHECPQGQRHGRQVSTPSPATTEKRVGGTGDIHFHEDH